MRSVSAAYDGQAAASTQQRALVVGHWALVCALAVPVVSAAEDPPFTVLEDTVIVRADRAWETGDGDSMIFEGRLELHANDWRIEADKALLNGRLDDPDRVVVDGSPARIVVGAPDEREPLEGRGQHLEFEPHSKAIRLEGAASVVKGEQSISSESIRYLLDKGTFSAGSHGRVRVVTKPRIK